MPGLSWFREIAFLSSISARMATTHLHLQLQLHMVSTHAPSFQLRHFLCPVLYFFPHIPVAAVAVLRYAVADETASALAPSASRFTFCAYSRYHSSKHACRLRISPSSVICCMPALFTTTALPLPHHLPHCRTAQQRYQRMSSPTSLHGGPHTHTYRARLASTYLAP